MNRLAWLLAAALSCHATGFAQQESPEPQITMVYMGGDDCPPCQGWRLFELPKLQKSEVFKRVKFFHAIKGIKSTVPPRMFLPAEIKEFKAKLDIASGGMGGSPQTAILVNGEIHDYYRGTRSAEQIEQMIESIVGNAPYPFARCLEHSSQGRCTRVAQGIALAASPKPR